MFGFEQRIRFSHCDPAAILYYPHVFDFVNAAVEDWFEQALGQSFHVLHLEHRLGNPVVRTQAEFLRACRFGETLRLEMTLEQLGRSSMQMRFSGQVAGEERFRVRHRTAMISMESLRATAIPERLRVRAQPFLVGASAGEGFASLEGTTPPPNAFTSRQTVRYEHCDPANRVYFARFFDMFNTALEDWFAEALACPWGSELMVPPRELRTPSLKIGVEFLRPCLLGETLEYRLWPTRLGRSSFDLALSASGDGVERLRARWTLCMTSHYTGHSVPIPGALRRRMQHLLPSQE